jgi:hypothetical protein
LTERLSVQGLTMQFAADPIRILGEDVQDRGNDEEDTAKYDGAFSRLLRSGRSIGTSMEANLMAKKQNHDSGDFDLKQEEKVEEVNQGLRQQSWQRVDLRGKVFNEAYETKKMEKWQKKSHKKFESYNYKKSIQTKQQHSKYNYK